MKLKGEKMRGKPTSDNIPPPSHQQSPCTKIQNSENSTMQTEFHQSLLVPHKPLNILRDMRCRGSSSPDNYRVCREQPKGQLDSR